MDMVEKEPADEEFVWKCPAVLLFSCQPDQAIESPRFQGGKVIAETEWVFSFYPRGDDMPDHISLFIKRVDDNKGQVNFLAKYRLCILDVDEKEHNSATCDHTFVKGTAHGVRKMIARKELFKDPHTLLPDKNIVFKCFIRKGIPKKRFASHTVLNTRVNVEEVNCQWPIENFLQVTEDNKALITLSTNTKRDFIEVTCYPSQESNQLHVSFKLSRTNPRVFVRTRVSILDKNKKVQVTKDGEKIFDDEGGVCTFPDLLEHQKLVEDFLVNDVLTIKFRLLISEGDKFSCVDAMLTPLSEKPVEGGTTLKKDLQKQSDSVLFPDIQVQVDGECFSTHKSLLAARSKVFLRKLEEMEARTDHHAEAGEDLKKEEAEENMEADTEAVPDNSSEIKDEGTEPQATTETTEDNQNMEADTEAAPANSKEIKDEDAEPQASTKTTEDNQTLEPDTEVAPDNSNEIKDSGTELQVNMETNEKLTDAESSKTEALKDHETVMGELENSTEKPAQKEQGKEILVIDDLDKDTFKRVLKFLYSDSIGTLDFDCGHRLYLAAVKYDIQLLSKKCLKQLSSLVTQGNAVRALLLSEETKDKSLRSEAIRVICEQKEDVFASREWLSLEKDNANLTKIVLDRISAKTLTSIEYIGLDHGN